MSEGLPDAESPFDKDRLFMLLGVVGNELAGLRRELEPLCNSLEASEVSRLTEALDTIERKCDLLLARVASHPPGH